MDEQRSALDSLMGINRNACGKEREKQSGESFKDPNVCKCFLVGFCPHELFKNTKREIGPCPYLHNDFVVNEFEMHPDVDALTRKYERNLKVFLTDIVREADRFIEKEKRNRQKPMLDINELLSDAEKELIEKLNNAAAELIAQSEIDAARLDFTLSEQRTAQALEAKTSAEAVRQRRWELYKKREEGDTICEVCGVHMEVFDQTEKDGRPARRNRTSPHELGKMHKGYGMVRAKIKEIEEKERAYRERNEGKSSHRERSGRRKPDEQREEKEQEKKLKETKLREEKENEREKQRTKEKEREKEKEKEKKLRDERRKEKEKEKELKEKKRSEMSDGEGARRADGRRNHDDAQKDDIAAHYCSRRPQFSKRFIPRVWNRSRSRNRRRSDSTKVMSRRPRVYEPRR